jgi:uncharacterized membrane protein
MIQQLLQKLGFVNQYHWSFPFRQEEVIERLNEIFVDENAISHNRFLKGSVDHSKFSATFESNGKRSPQVAIVGNISSIGSACRVSYEFQSHVSTVKRILRFIVLVWIILFVLFTYYLPSKGLDVPAGFVIAGYLLTLIYVVPIILCRVFADQHKQRLSDALTQMGGSIIQPSNEINTLEQKDFDSVYNSSKPKGTIRRKWVYYITPIYLPVFVAAFVFGKPIYLGIFAILMIGVSIIGFINKDFRNNIFNEGVKESDQKIGLAVIGGVFLVFTVVFTFLFSQ